MRDVIESIFPCFIYLSVDKTVVNTKKTHPPKIWKIEKFLKRHAFTYHFDD